MPISVAPMLKRQCPSPSFGHGWIMGCEGKRWHPSNDQKVLLRELSSVKPNFIQRISKVWGK
ncbi:phage filamentation protein Fil family protein [Erwinia sp. Eh17-17]|uniref:phage filamentation protein Fil family protein n=1 Tax=Erwinia sp. Eh17-17 TaxID=3080330 RepID=UPI00320944C8